jgi:hypothetical protein
MSSSSPTRLQNKFWSPDYHMETLFVAISGLIGAGKV